MVKRKSPMIKKTKVKKVIAKRVMENLGVQKTPQPNQKRKS